MYFYTKYLNQTKKTQLSLDKLDLNSRFERKIDIYKRGGNIKNETWKSV